MILNLTKRQSHKENLAFLRLAYHNVHADPKQKHWLQFIPQSFIKKHFNPVMLVFIEYRFLHHFVLAKLETSSIRVNITYNFSYLRHFSLDHICRR